MENYKYICEDNSLTCKIFKKFLYYPIAEIIPIWVSPNFITIFGILCSITSGLFVWLGINFSKLYFLPAAFFVFLYLICDNLDGIHARRTSQTSSLGEFLDHWLDSITITIISLSLFYFFKFDKLWIALCSCIVCISFFSSIWEQYRRGVFYYTVFGSQEGILFVLMVYISAIFIPDSMLIYNPGHFNLSLICATITIIINFYIIIGSILRVRKNFVDYIYPVILCLMFSLGFFLKHLPLLLGAAIILSINIYFSSSLTLSRLTGKKYTLRKIFSIVIGFIGTILTFFNFQENIYIGFIIICMILILSGIIIDLIYAYKKLPGPARNGV